MPARAAFSPFPSNEGKFWPATGIGMRGRKKPGIKEVMTVARKGKPDDNKDCDYIYRAWRRDPKTGKVLWAKDYGLKAWRIPVPANPQLN